MLTINYTACKSHQEELIRQAEGYRLVKSLTRARASKSSGKAGRLLRGLLSLI